MSDFRFKRLEKHKFGGTKDKMELNIPLPKSPTGKIYRWCPNEDCSPRLFLLGEVLRPENLDVSQMRRPPGTVGTTCPYCSIDADDDKFNYAGDIQAIQKYVAWAVSRDIDDHLRKMSREINHSQRRGGMITIKMDVKSHRTPEPRAWREDLIRSLACDACGREYSVYAIALFCPDCGCKNLHIHFEREIELILKQIDIAEYVAKNGDNELSYRILGNAHEDVVTAFETYQKTFYKYMIRRSFSVEVAQKMSSKRAIGNRFQNIERAKDLYKNLSVDPFDVLLTGELDLMKLNIEKRHVIGHNLSIADETYSYAEDRETLGTTVGILADEITEFADTAKKIIVELERML